MEKDFWLYGMREWITRINSPREIAWMAVAVLILFVILIPSTLFVAHVARNNSISQESKTKATPKPISLNAFEPQKVKLWQITISYVISSSTYSFKNIKIVDGILPDYRLNDLSPFTLTVFQNENELFKTKIHINTMPVGELTNGGNPRLSVVDSALYVPFQDGADKIVISLHDKKILEIPVSSTTFYTPFHQAHAEQPDSKLCGSMTVAVINDGYKLANGEIDQARFNADIDFMKKGFADIEPYKGKIDTLFQFVPKPIKESLQCGRNILYEGVSTEYCVVGEGAGKIRSIMPGAARYIVLSDNFTTGGYFGIASDIGGDIAIFSSRNTRDGEESYVYTANHEFLGHSVGFLHDRYIYQDQRMQAEWVKEITTGKVPKSNCSDSARGESFWKDVSSSVGQGCEAQSLYAPAERDCGANGNSQTIMSSGNCAPRITFDPVEQFWIKNTILSKITSCKNGQNNGGKAANDTKACKDYKSPVECNKVDGCLYYAHVGCLEGNRASAQMCNDDGTNKPNQNGEDSNVFCRDIDICDLIPLKRVPDLEKELSGIGKIFPAMCVKPRSILDRGPCNSDASCGVDSYCSDNVCCSKGSAWDRTKKDCVANTTASIPLCLACENIINAWNACEGNTIYTYRLQGKFQNGICTYPNPTKAKVKDCSAGTICVNKVGNTNLENAPECVPVDSVSSCGGAGQACCLGEKFACKDGLECNGNVCTEVCGGAGQPCCTAYGSSPTCDFAELSCQGGICRTICSLEVPIGNTR